MVSIWLWRWIHIHKIPENISNIEDTKIFRVLLKLFNKFARENQQQFERFKNIFGKKSSENFTDQEIYWNNLLLRQFENFVNWNYLKNQIKQRAITKI